MVSEQPTVFHITHVKSGSQWVYQILNDCDPYRIVKPLVKVAQFYKSPILPGRIYPTVYVPRDRFETTLRPHMEGSDIKTPPYPDDLPIVQNYFNFVKLRKPVKIFVVIRDLRDALVSLYFSLKVSHALISDNVAYGHHKLNELNIEDGLLYLFGQNNGELMAAIQRTWLPVCRQGAALMIRYEDMIEDEMAQFAKIINYCEIDLPVSQFREIVSQNSFFNQSGRKRGEEDISSHFRKGVAGDWKNHFTDRVKEEFKNRFGRLLIDAGYEKDLLW